MISRAAPYYKETSVTSGAVVTLDEFKAYARIVGTVEDSTLTRLIASATDIAERYTNRWFLTRTADGFWHNLDCSPYVNYPFVEIRKAPLQSIQSVEIWDGSAFEATTDYELKERNAYSRVVFPDYFKIDTYTLPEDAEYRVKISFTAGYGDAEDVPDSIKTAIMAIANFLNDNRGDCGCGGSQIPSVAKTLLGPYKIISTFA